MWKVFIRKIVTDPTYGTRIVETELCEGSLEYCQKYSADHPGSYFGFCCDQARKEV